MEEVIAHWPVEYSDQLVLANMSSNIAICCLWSDKNKIKALLNAGDYSVIGNLYSRAGINPMLRNILANPNLRYIILTGKSLTDSDEALLNFFDQGIDIDWRIKGNGGQIDRDLAIAAIEDIRANVKVIDLRRSKDFAADFRKEASQLEKLLPFNTPRVFPKTPQPAQTFPSEFVGFTIRQQTIFEAWCESVWLVMTFGCTSPTDYGVQQKESLALISIIENPALGIDKFPQWAPYRKEEVQAYLDRFFEAEYSDAIAYNYGHRLQSYWAVNQIELIAAELRRSGFSRRAVANLWDPIKDSNSADPPCLTTIQTVIRDGRLHLIAYIRSNDTFRAYPLNAASLAELQARILKQLSGVDLGSLTILSYSSHIYSDCWDSCQSPMNEAAKFRRRFEQDPRGSFVFRQEDGRLLAEHYNPAGDLIQTFDATSGGDLANLIAPFVSRIDHAMYLGREIDRLAAAVATKNYYEQDKVPQLLHEDQ